MSAKINVAPQYFRPTTLAAIVADFSQFLDTHDTVSCYEVRVQMQTALNELVNNAGEDDARQLLIAADAVMEQVYP